MDMNEMFSFDGDRLHLGNEAKANHHVVGLVIGEQQLSVLTVSPGVGDQFAESLAQVARENGYSSITVPGMNPAAVRRAVLDLRQAGLAESKAVKTAIAAELAALAATAEHPAGARTLRFAGRKASECKVSAEAIDTATDALFSALAPVRFADRCQWHLERLSRPPPFEAELQRQLQQIQKEGQA